MMPASGDIHRERLLAVLSEASTVPGMPVSFWVSAIVALFGGIAMLAAKSIDVAGKRAQEEIERIDKREGRVDTLENRVYVRNGYIETLREHISGREPPPPPRCP